jgi:GTP-binding protein Era
MGEIRAAMPASNAGPHRFGYVGIAGRPNAGKSTLLNALIGAKLAIVAPKPQTTRTTIQGVLTRPSAQIVFVDTPGIHESTNTFNRRMMQTVRAAIEGRDVILYVADCTLPLDDREKQALDAVRKTGVPVILALNKVDRVEDKRLLLPIIEQYAQIFSFQEIVPLSARKGTGIEELVATLGKLLPEGPALYPEDYLTDQPMRFLAAELVREQILKVAQQEVPHSVAVLVEKWEESEQLVRINAVICVEKDGQKRILVGDKGAVVKQVGTAARIEIEKWTGRKVYLELFVKVVPKWRENPAFLNELDWRLMAAPAETFSPERQEDDEAVVPGNGADAEPRPIPVGAKGPGGRRRDRRSGANPAGQ